MCFCDIIKKKILLRLAQSLFALFLCTLAVCQADAYTLTPETWNITGLDSNDVTVGPNRFPVGAKVCGGTPGGTADVYFSWLSSNSYIELRPGSKGFGGTPLTVTFNAGGCADAFFEAEIARNPSAYETSRQYKIHIGGDSTPAGRELFVEKLISQARNAITDVKVDGVSIPAGGTMNLVLGNTYTIQLIGGTATQGYNQFSSFFSLSNTIFQVLSVSTSYSANSSPYVPDPVYGSGLYADACKWDSDPGSPTYRSCIGGDYKAGGSNVVTTYQIKIIGGGGSAVTLSSMLFDFSGASYHYNGDYATSTRIATITDPLTLGIAKSFSPNPTNSGGVSALTVTISNPNAGAVSGAGFTDIFPIAPGAMTLYDSSATNSCGGTLTTSSGAALTAGAAGIRLSGGTVPGYGNCTVQVNITPAVTGTYSSTTGNLFVNSVDTGKNATASLTVNATPPPPAPPSSCASPVELARWTMDPAQGTATPPLYFSKASDVATAVASYNANGSAGSQTVGSGLGNPVNSWYASGWALSSTGFPSPTTGPFYQFDLDSSKYGNITISADSYIGSGTWAAPANNFLYMYSSANGGAYSTIYNANLPKGSWQTIPATAAATGSTTTSFRINAVGAKTSADVMYIDNIIFTGCPRPAPPAISKSFSPNPVAVGGTSTLTYSITNQSTSALTGVAVTDNLPQMPLQGTVTVTNGSAVVSGTGSAFKTQLTTGSVISINNVSYTVLTISSDSQLTLTTNYSGTTNSGIVISAGLTIAGPVTASQCGGTVSSSAGGSSIVFSGGTLAASGSCTITVPVKNSIAGVTSSVSEAISSVESGQNNTSGGIATATLSAVLPPMFKEIAASNLASTVWSYYLALPVGGSVYYQYQVQNDGDAELVNVQVTDDKINMAACTWHDGDGLVLTTPFTLAVANAANNKDFATCTIGPLPVASAGFLTSTATGEGYFGGTKYTDTDYVTYATTALTLAISAAEASFSAGDTLHYSYTVLNNGYATLNSPVTVTDSKTTVTCPALATIGNLNNFFEPGETLTCTATYPVTAADVTAGEVTNSASASTPSAGAIAGTTSPTVMKTVPLVSSLPLITITKSANQVTAAPGQVITYTVRLESTGVSASSNVVLTDALSPFVAFSLNTYGAGVRFNFIDSVPASGLALGVPVYSADSGSSWAHTPLSGANGAPAGFDGSISNWKIPMTGTLRSGGSCEITYQAIIK